MGWGGVLVLAACTASPGTAASGTAAAAAGEEAAKGAAAQVSAQVVGVTPLDGWAAVATRFGTVAVTGEDSPRELALDGNTALLGLDADLIGLVALIRWPDRDAVMVWRDCSGSSCGWPSYRILELQAGAPPRWLEDDYFSAGDVSDPASDAGTPLLQVQGDGSVRIGTAGDERGWFVYRPGQLERE